MLDRGLTELATGAFNLAWDDRRAWLRPDLNAICASLTASGLGSKAIQAEPVASAR